MIRKILFFSALSAVLLPEWSTARTINNFTQAKGTVSGTAVNASTANVR